MPLCRLVMADSICVWVPVHMLIAEPGQSLYGVIPQPYLLQYGYILIQRPSMNHKTCMLWCPPGALPAVRKKHIQDSTTVSPVDTYSIERVGISISISSMNINLDSVMTISWPRCLWIGLFSSRFEPVKCRCDCDLPGLAPSAQCRTSFFMISPFPLQLFLFLLVLPSERILYRYFVLIS